MGTNFGDLNYHQRLHLGAIRARREFADEARSKAVQASIGGDFATAAMFHAEADQHENAIVKSSFQIAQLA